MPSLLQQILDLEEAEKNMKQTYYDRIDKIYEEMRNNILLIAISDRVAYLKGELSDLKEQDKVDLDDT
jgi:hypothetical protein